MSAPVTTASSSAVPFLTESPAASSRDHPIQVQTRVELVRMAYRELTGGTLASGGVALAFAVGLALGTSTSATMILSWTGVMIAISVYRLWLVRAFKRAAPTVEESSSWGLRYVVATTLAGVGWGVSAWLFPTLSGGSRIGLLHVTMLAGLAAGSARMLLPMRKGALVYLFVVMTPLAARFLAEGDAMGILMGFSVGIFIAYMATATQRNHKMLSDALVSRFEREALAAELQAENARRETRETELQEAREKAESASRAKGEFLATISHEIRTPMNGVLGMLRIVRDTNLSAEQRG